MPGVLSHWETIVCKLRTESVLACEWNTIGKIDWVHCIIMQAL